MTSHARIRTAAARSLIALLCLTWGATATATPDFPAVVVKTLDLPAITIDPPLGCELCHTSDSGGTSLRTFGSLLLQYGAQPYEENTLEQALGQVEQNEPQLIADIKASRDPNDDPDTGDVHTPSYGCDAARGRSPYGLLGASPLVALAALAGLLLRRKLAGRPRRLPRPAPERR